MLAYALGAALVVVPLAAALFLFGSDNVNTAASQVDNVISTPRGQPPSGGGISRDPPDPATNTAVT